MGCEPRGDSVKEVLGGAREPHQASLAFERVQGALVGFPAQPRVSPRFLNRIRQRDPVYFDLLE